MPGSGSNTASNAGTDRPSLSTHTTTTSTVYGGRDTPADRPGTLPPTPDRPDTLPPTASTTFPCKSNPGAPGTGPMSPSGTSVDGKQTACVTSVPSVQIPRLYPVSLRLGSLQSRRDT